MALCSQVYNIAAAIAILPCKAAQFSLRCCHHTAQTDFVNASMLHRALPQKLVSDLAPGRFAEIKRSKGGIAFFVHLRAWCGSSSSSKCFMYMFQLGIVSENASWQASSGAICSQLASIARPCMQHSVAGDGCFQERMSV